MDCDPEDMHKRTKQTKKKKLVHMLNKLDDTAELVGWLAD